MKQKIFIFLMLRWMTVIFSYSRRTGEVSTEDSHRIGMAVGEIFIKDFDQWEYSRQLEFARKVDHPIRKAAHASEYALLAFFAFGAVGDIDLKKRFLSAQAISTLYAASDEFHQSFVPGRDGNLKDVLIDSCGAVAMLICIWAVVWVIKKKTDLLGKANQKGF